MFLTFNLTVNLFSQSINDIAAESDLLISFYQSDTTSLNRVIDSLGQERGNENQIAFYLGNILRSRLFKDTSNSARYLQKIGAIISKESPYYGDYIVQKTNYDYIKDQLITDSLLLLVMKDSQYYSPRNIAELYHATGVNLREQTIDDLSKAYFLIAYHSDHASKTNVAKASYANSLGLVYGKEGNTERGIELLNFAVKNGRIETQKSALANLSINYAKAGEIDTALVLINKALDLNNKTLYKNRNLLGTRANIYLTKKQYDKAIVDYETEFQTLDESDYITKAINRLNIGMSYNGLKKTNVAIASFEEASFFAKKTKNYRLRDFILSNLNPLHKKNGNWKLVSNLSEERWKLKDSIDQNNRMKMVEEMEAKYGLKEAKVKQELAESKAIATAFENKKQKQYLFGGTLLLSLFSFSSFLFYRQREKQKQLNTELTSQRDQIKLLNRELNHRVKNNLAFMTSLLEMQGRRTDSDEAKQVLRESESRLKALSIVHNNLFQNDTHTTINLKSYLLEIAQHLQNIFEIPGKSLQLETQLADLDFDAEDAMRVGLIVNELVTNSVKHAFANVDNPKIILETSRSADGKVSLRYQDNGPGFIQKEIKEPVSNASSIGVKLIQLLEQQLAAKLDLQVS